jgi:16S rRNA (guanine966-N2)-methyltransferase
MRIVAGKWRGRRIEAPSGDDVRPTLDRVREAWMSILQPDIPGARVLDLFAGSGALGLEALSRGAESVTLVEKSAKSIRAISSNIEALGAGDAATIKRADAILFAKGLSAGEFDVAFADPPYEGGFAPKLASIWLETPFASILSIEHNRGEKMPDATDTRRYGTSAITFYRTEE